MPGERKIEKALTLDTIAEIRRAGRLDSRVSGITYTGESTEWGNLSYSYDTGGWQSPLPAAVGGSTAL
jgi:hypothetical protein